MVSTVGHRGADRWTRGNAGLRCGSTPTTPRGPELPREVFRHEPGDTAAAALRLDAVVPDPVDRAAFRAAHPQVRGTAQEWLDRLNRALESA
ncbi:hypothetical protein PV367_44705 [Streptomyces europaeiscabiei]|uniref:Uncharacterized protein n=1 Tax=Streptomyces europaeiscabiei TaxID=146819 RepID=A0AAJ2Q106_9ACTN|nr:MULTISPECIES: hypothetical protein [Streptomyces]MDX3136742.1 hypothetical protein [Streptomyces europaeiscabiei]